MDPWLGIKIHNQRKAKKDHFEYIKSFYMNKINLTRIRELLIGGGEFISNISGKNLTSKVHKKLTKIDKTKTQSFPK